MENNRETMSSNRKRNRILCLWLETILFRKSFYIYYNNIRQILHIPNSGFQSFLSKLQIQNPSWYMHLHLEIRT